MKKLFIYCKDGDILRDVEANTVRLKEHGQDVLVLEKMNAIYRTFSDNYHRSLSVPINAAATNSIGNLATDIRPKCWFVFL
uniref:DNA polymerase III subunit delta n=1 Tax=Elaeophora elaphi TaxID=1147741 RepID=A0A0R3RMF5_9BILA